MTIRQVIGALLLALAFSGCTAVQNHEVAKLETFSDVSHYEHKPSAYINIHGFHGDPESGSASEITQATDELKPVVQRIIDESKLFSSYTFDASKQQDVDYTITLNLYNHGNEMLAMLSGFITGFSFFIIPGGGTDNYTLQLKAVATADNTETTVQNRDSVTTWVGIWFIPMMGNGIREATDETLENQLRDALQKLFESGALEYSQLEGFSQPSLDQGIVESNTYLGG
ncbi:hypothetical protein LOH54_05555 [Sulfurimonas sp. HSL-3221]|uniref:hypothetical protein n=1 Tax=Thiomicrolovo sulfuroxydans TaxID=2894755 RepID=UPI001E32F658|nr:hypothetical protein [Sulfurimonas sp. HSL-3221]UFS63597.1 hypothetical protein LOH54_05555 [Sulfurimonas sp. HSL-3221]